MADWPKSVLSRIKDGTLLPAAHYGELDYDAALDARDRDSEFDSEWVRLSDEIERRWGVATIHAEAEALVEDIRRESFLAVSRATQQHEIASYVSDDFELIVKGRLLGMEESFLRQLWTVYERGDFPRPPL
jgi:hypothetical protein